LEETHASAQSAMSIRFALPRFDANRTFGALCGELRALSRSWYSDGGQKTTTHSLCHAVKHTSRLSGVKGKGSSRDNKTSLEDCVRSAKGLFLLPWKRLTSGSCSRPAALWWPIARQARELLARTVHSTVYVSPQTLP
jgi:hypothetical protein